MQYSSAFILVGFGMIIGSLATSFLQKERVVTRTIEKCSYEVIHTKDSGDFLYMDENLYSISVMKAERVPVHFPSKPANNR